MNKTIASPAAPAAVGPYCQAKLCGNTLYTSGQLGLVPETGKLAEGIEGQAHQSQIGREHVRTPVTLS